MFEYHKKFVTSQSRCLGLPDDVLAQTTIEKNGRLVPVIKSVPFVNANEGIHASFYAIDNLIRSGVSFDASKPMYLQHSPIVVNEMLPTNEQIDAIISVQSVESLNSDFNESNNT